MAISNYHSLVIINREYNCMEITKQVKRESYRWCKKNKWFGVDKDRTQYAFIIHSKLIDDYDISVNTKGYYKIIDAFMSYYNEVRKLKLTKEQIKLAKRIGIPITRTI